MRGALLCALLATASLLQALEWQALVDEKLTPEAAQAASVDGTFPEGKVSSFTLEDTVFDLENLTGRVMPRQSKALLLATIHADHPGVVPYNLTANWESYVYVNGELAFASGEKGNIYSVGRIGRRISLPLQAGDNRVAVLVNRVAAFQVWGFAFWQQPETEHWPKDAAERKLLYERLFPKPETPSLVYRPWIHKLSCDRAEIGIRIDIQVACGIRWRAVGEEKYSEKWDTLCGRRTLVDLHRFVISGLKADTEYEYEICWLDAKGNRVAPLADARGSFRTWPDTATPFTFYLFSDLQVLSRAKFITDILQNFDVSKADFVASLGDMNSSFDDFDVEYFPGFLELLKDNGCQRPYVPVRGNHEYRGRETERYQLTFGRPYYSFTYGDTFFMVLDTGEDAYGFSEYRRWSDVGEYFQEQAEWLERTIASDDCKNARRRIVLAHAPPFEFENRTYRSGIDTITRSAFYGDEPKCRLDAWICGDTHSPYRYDPATGSRVGAFPRDDARPLTERDKAEIRFPVVVNDGPYGAGSMLSVLKVEMTADSMNFTAINDKLEVVDQFVIRSGQPFEVSKTSFQEY